MALPNGGGGSLQTLSSFISMDISMLANSTVNVTSLSLAPGTWVIDFQAELSQGASAGGWELFIGTTTASLTGALGGGEETASGNTVYFMSGSIVVKPTSTTTYYLNLFNSGSSGGTVKAAGILNNFGANVSGMVATKTA